ncbi:MAG TPA: hypothetical protein VN426_11625 [Syntrophomonadaceae bacterium]|nr:hypothetical protein [Syntrophomonadaceae bacterium]
MDHLLRKLEQEKVRQAEEIKRLRVVVEIARERQKQIDKNLKLEPYTMEWMAAVQKIGQLDTQLEQALVALARIEKAGEENA